MTTTPFMFATGIENSYPTIPITREYYQRYRIPERVHDGARGAAERAG